MGAPNFAYATLPGGEETLPRFYFGSVITPARLLLRLLLLQLGHLGVRNAKMDPEEEDPLLQLCLGS
jgi:hypothetical protein